MSTAMAFDTRPSHRPGSTGRVRSLLRSYIATLRNWPTAGLLVALAHPSPLPPRRGFLVWPLRHMPVTLRSRSGLRIRCRLDEAVAFVEVFTRRDYDVPGLDWSGLRSIVDVGANVGMASLWMAQQAPHARIVAVEPAADTASRLRANVDRNRLAGRISLVVAGVAGAAGRASMVFGEGFSTHGVLDRSATGEIELRTLDDILDGTGMDSVDLLKIDCEGGEYDALRGPALQRLRRIVGEYHIVPGHEPAELEETLRDAGFEVSMEPPVGDAGRFRAWRDAE